MFAWQPMQALPPRTARAALLCLLVAAPAAATERSEARRYADAMQGLTEPTPEETEALVAGNGGAVGPGAAAPLGAGSRGSCGR